MTEEAGQSIWPATEADEGAPDLVTQVLHRGRPRIEQLLLDGASAEFLRVHLGSVGVQPFPMVVLRKGSQELLDQLGMVGGQMIPDHLPQSPHAGTDVLS